MFDEEWAERVNRYPSILYDANLLPEQIETAEDLAIMATICYAYMQGRADAN